MNCEHRYDNHLQGHRRAWARLRNAKKNKQAKNNRLFLCNRMLNVRISMLLVCYSYILVCT